MDQEAVIVAAARTAVGRAKRGSLASVRPDEMIAAVIQDLMKRAAPLRPEDVDDVIIGCAFPEGEQGMNVGRMAALRAGLPISVPGQTVNRFCSSGLQTIANGAAAILAGMVDVVIAGGAESMTMVPMAGNKFAPNPGFAAEQPEVYTSMGLTAENVAARYGVHREDQDAFALSSHQKAIAAIDGGRFRDEIVPLKVQVVEAGSQGRSVRDFVFEVDEGPRRDTSAESLAKLKPAFKLNGTVTAGNSSQMSDGAAAVLVMSAGKAKALGLVPLARFVTYAVGGVAPEIMGVGPVEAIPKALRRAGLTLDEIDLIELNEAFAAQSLAVLRTLEIDPAKANVNGGAIALGHPLGMSGARLITTMLHEMERQDLRYGLACLCIGFGMGAATIIERPT